MVEGELTWFSSAGAATALRRATATATGDGDAVARAEYRHIDNVGSLLCI